MKLQSKPIGLTKEAGWQFGLRKTFSFSQEHLWDFMFSAGGIRIWLGNLEGELRINEAYEAKEGIEGQVRVFKSYSHIRMTWKKEKWENFSTVQVRVMGGQEKATVSFHQEKLLDNDQREEMKCYWNKKMAEIERALVSQNNNANKKIKKKL